MIVHSSKNPIILNEGLISKFKEKPFKGKFADMKFVIRNRKTDNVDVKRIISYIESNILPQLDLILDNISEKYRPLIYKNNPEKFKDKVYKSCKSLVLSRELVGDKFVLSTTCLMTNTEIIFKGYISDDGQSIDFKLFDVVTTTYMVV